MIHLVSGDVLDDGVDPLPINGHYEDLISGLMLKTNTFRGALETVGNARKSPGLDNLKYLILTLTITMEI